MTVKELIAVLAALPSDAVVCVDDYTQPSDGIGYIALTAGMCRLGGCGYAPPEFWDEDKDGAVVWQA